MDNKVSVISIIVKDEESAGESMNCSMNSDSIL